MNLGHAIPSQRSAEHYDENTLFRVYDSLRRTMTEKQAREALQNMQNDGILFREKTLQKSGAVYRGAQEGDVPVGTPSNAQQSPS